MFNLNSLRENWKEIKKEYEKICEEAHPWPEGNLFEKVDPNTKKRKEGEGWNVFGLYAFGKKNPTNCDKCPITTKIVENLPYKILTAAFSILVPHSHIVPHSGYVGYSDRVFRCHLGLQVPPREKNEIRGEYKPRYYNEMKPKLVNCRLRVADQWMDWEEGNFFVFDDSLVHEAWNFTDQIRVILLLDFERPPQFMPNLEELQKTIEKANKDPLKNGNKGDIYLDKLTNNHGY